MKFGVREICDVVLRAKNRMQVGNKIFYKHEPVIYFDTLKTSSMEGAANTVYAQGGRGNSRLVAWEGERTITFTMEDALISPEGFMILSGAGLVEAKKDQYIYQHVTEVVDGAKLVSSSEVDGNNTSAVIQIPLKKRPHLPDNQGDNFAYVMFMRDGSIVTEPYIPIHGDDAITETGSGSDRRYWITVRSHPCYDDLHADSEEVDYLVDALDNLNKYDSVLVDFYVERQSGAQQIEITPDKFGGNFYLEASTLFRDQNGVDMPAEFIIPNCKIQSNFTFTMASSGDPSSFTFTMDAFPDYTRFDHSKKVLAAIQIIEEESSQDLHRGGTPNGDYVAEEAENNGVHELTDRWKGQDTSSNP